MGTASKLIIFGLLAPAALLANPDLQFTVGVDGIPKLMEIEHGQLFVDGARVFTSMDFTGCLRKEGKNISWLSQDITYTFKNESAANEAWAGVSDASFWGAIDAMYHGAVFFADEEGRSTLCRVQVDNFTSPQLHMHIINGEHRQDITFAKRLNYRLQPDGKIVFSDADRYALLFDHYEDQDDFLKHHGDFSSTPALTRVKNFVLRSGLTLQIGRDGAFLGGRLLFRVPKFTGHLEYGGSSSIVWKDGREGGLRLIFRNPDECSAAWAIFSNPKFWRTSEPGLKGGIFFDRTPGREAVYRVTLAHAPSRLTFSVEEIGGEAKVLTLSTSVQLHPVGTGMDRVTFRQGIHELLFYRPDAARAFLANSRQLAGQSQAKQ